MFENFFKYPNQYRYDGSDLLSPKQFIVTGILLVIIISLTIILRKANHNKIKWFLRISSIVVPITDIIGTMWSYSYNLSVGAGFNLIGDLPLYTCSLFMFTLPFAAWGKGRARDVCLGFLTTLGIVAGLSNFIYLNILGSYPLMHYKSFNSIFYHGMMVFIGIYLLTSGYVKPKLINVHYSMLVIFVFSAFAIPITYQIFYTKSKWVDYMLYINGAGLPIISNLANYFKGIGWMSLYTITVMVVGYGVASFLVYGISKLIEFLVHIGKKKNA